MAARKAHRVKDVEKRWLTVAEAEKYLGFGTRNTQQEWRDSGLLPYCIVGRVILYDIADLDNFVMKHKVQFTNIKAQHYERQAQ